MKIIGYFNSFDDRVPITMLDLEPLTHVNYAFLLPKADGTVYFKDKRLAENTVAYCHKRGKRIFVSVGGWCDENIVLNYTFERICSSKKTRDIFVDEVIKVVRQYDFDGVDLDWEYPSKSYKKDFILILKKLKKVLEKENRELTIAIHHAVKGDAEFRRVIAITDKVFKYVDWINVMTYDCHTETNHSSLKLAMSCYDYWVNERGLDKEKFLIGIPFYSKPSCIPYFELIQKSESNAERDFYHDESYNGTVLVKAKVDFAKVFCGGVFIWAINYDSVDKHSLLRTIESAL